MDDFLDDFIDYDVVMGSDEAKCPKCGEIIPVSVVLDVDEIECPRCHHKFDPFKK